MKMDTLRRLALGICVLCVAGGIIQIFWPENSYKPVINTALMLYIIASVLQMRPGTIDRLPQIDWESLTENVQPSEYQAYAQDLALETSVQALVQILQQEGIAAHAELADGVCQVTLSDPEDAARAQQILAENSGSLPFVLLPGGDGS